MEEVEEEAEAAEALQAQNELELRDHSPIQISERQDQEMEEGGGGDEASRGGSQGSGKGERVGEGEEQDVCQRLMIDRIVLKNFKSYYGVKTIGPFHKCFTAVVGPNGSGKSNLIESLLFVFGKRAKRMRLKKLCELVHSSAKHDVSDATVEVYFQTIRDYYNEPDYYEVVENTKFRIARRVDKNSNSRYMIDGLTATYKQVIERLSRHGIDLEHNRFLILQGEVEQISLMKPIAQNENEVGLLEYLEDIIGSNRNIEEIEEKEASINKQNEQRIEKTNRVKAKKSELDSMESEKNMALNYIEAERNTWILMNMLYYIELKDSATHFNECVMRME